MKRLKTNLTERFENPPDFSTVHEEPVTETNPEHHLVVFKGKNIRCTLHQGEWWFSVVDIILALTDSSQPRRYWSDLKRKLSDKERFFEVYEKIVQLKLALPVERGNATI